MNLLLRTFRAQPGREHDLIDALHKTATRMIQQQETLSVLTCQRVDDRPQLIWIENRGREPVSGPSALGAQVTTSWQAFLGHASLPLPLEFLDGSYRFPLPPCRVWSVELDAWATRNSETLRLLFDLPRRAGADAHVVGLSLYRTVGISPLMIGFLALTRGITPDDLLQETVGRARGKEPASIWHPLSVLWTAGRLSSDSGPGPSVSATRYPRTAFWARSGVLAASSGPPSGPAAPAGGAAAASQRPERIDNSEGLVAGARPNGNQSSA